MADHWATLAARRCWWTGVVGAGRVRPGHRVILCVMRAVLAGFVLPRSARDEE